MIESIKIRKIKGALFFVLLIGLMLLMNVRLYAKTSSEDILDKPFCFKICPSSVDSSGFMEDLYTLDIRIDLYKIGDIKYISEGNSYELYNIDKNKYEEVSKLNCVNIENMNYTGSEWKALSQDAVRKALSEPLSTPAKDAGLGDEIKDITPGLYLMVVRSAESDELESYKKISSEGEILTFVQSEEYEYTFEPNLIVIPIWSIQSELQESIKKGNCSITDSLEYGESTEVYEIYIKTSRESKEKTIDGAVDDSFDEIEGDSVNNKNSYESESSGNSYKSVESGDSYKSYKSNDSYRSDDSYKSGSRSESIVKTGDDHNILYYCILALIFGSCSIILVFSIYLKRR